MRRRRIASFLALAVTFSSLIATPIALAAKQADEHCVYRLVAVSTSPETSTTEAVVEEEGCFETFSEAIAYGSGGEVTVDSAVGPADLTQDMVAAAAIPDGGDVLIGVEYNQPNYDGSSAAYFASSGCASTTWEVPYVTDKWNDLFESGRGYGSCDRNRKFAGSQFGGASLLCSPNCSNYGSLRNEVSSLRWRAD
jgi:hypothetical protein